MCMMAMPAPPPPPKPSAPRIDEFDPSKVPDDMVNNVRIENKHDRSKMKANRAANRGPVATPQSVKTDKAY